MGLNEIAWDDYKDLGLYEKGKFLIDGNHVEHALIAQQFGRKELDYLGELATKIRFIAKTREGMDFLNSQLPHKRAMLYFTQPSTRTFLSFFAACQILGLRIGNVRDTATSSEFKGETQEDSVRSFSSYYDLIVMRTKKKGLAERMAWVLANSERPIPIINAGSGQDQHPTQALLDIYTLQRSFEGIGGIDGKTVMFVGDLARGRTVRSLAGLLTNYAGVKLLFVAPEQLQISDEILKLLDDADVSYEITSEFEERIPEANAIYMTRIQDEWDAHKGESAKVDTTKFCFKAEHLDVLKKDAVLMHPLPRRNEISTDVDHDPRAVYWRQMRNGMWIRTALIANIFAVDKSILNYENQS